MYVCMYVFSMHESIALDECMKDKHQTIDNMRQLPPQSVSWAPPSSGIPFFLQPQPTAARWVTMSCHQVHYTIATERDQNLKWGYQIWMAYLEKPYSNWLTCRCHHFRNPANDVCQEWEAINQLLNPASSWIRTWPLPGVKLYFC